MVAETNANDVVILKGVGLNERVYLSTPKGKEEDAVILLPELNGKRQKKKEDKKDPAAPASPIAQAAPKK